MKCSQESARSNAGCFCLYCFHCAFMKTRSLKTLYAAITLILLTSCGPSFQMISPEALELARNGVSANSEWTPTIQSIDGVSMALVPAGCFQMGSSEAQLQEAQFWCDKFNGIYGCKEDFGVEQPEHEVCFDQPFFIDQVEVSNRAYGEMAGTDLEQVYPFDRDWSWPRETVTWEEAAKFCVQRGARLPSEAEWEFAARGPDALIYPWGNTFDPMDVNWNSGHPYATGTKHEWVSWVGVYDMAAGVAEWVDGWYAPYGEESTDSGEFRIVRGGHWFSRAAYFWRTASREPLPADYASSTVGFRCAMDFDVVDLGKLLP